MSGRPMPTPILGLDHEDSRWYCTTWSQRPSSMSRQRQWWCHWRRPLPPPQTPPPRPSGSNFSGQPPTNVPGTDRDQNGINPSVLARANAYLDLMQDVQFQVIVNFDQIWVLASIYFSIYCFTLGSVVICAYQAQEVDWINQGQYWSYLRGQP